MLLEIAQKRYSVRKYKDIPVEKDKIRKVLEAARIAPSACNFQPWHFVVITEKDKIDKIAEVYSGNWIRRAPVIIVACGDHAKSWKRFDGKDHCDIDVAIAIEHMTLAAADLGLGTCWICSFDARRCGEILGLPNNLEAIALLPMGYPLEETAPGKIRFSMEEIISWNDYKDK